MTRRLALFRCSISAAIRLEIARYTQGAVRQLGDRQGETSKNEGACLIRAIHAGAARRGDQGENLT
jgi:hypothetical protein